MEKPLDRADALRKRADRDAAFRARLIAKPRDTVEREFGVTLPEGHEIHVHEETHAATHVVLPPRSKLTEAEREEAKAGATSLEFLKKTMYDPAPPIRPPVPERTTVLAAGTLIEAAGDGIRRGLDFLEAGIGSNGAWHCIRFNLADGDIPRHFERPAFVSAFCALALERCRDARAQAICAATRAYLADTIEYPGLWRYYRHLPPDLDSTALCSMLIGNHPWILLGRNVPRMLANRDDEGRFLTWLLEEDQPDVVAPFRIEADPVVNANVVAYLGENPATRDAQAWLAALIDEDRLDGTSKWYPDPVAIHYAIARAMVRARPALGDLRSTLADRVLGLRDADGSFGNILQTAQAVSALDNLGVLDRIDAKAVLERFVGAQHEDGSWPELLAFGDQTLKWGSFGQIGHGSEAVTTAFCLEAIARLRAVLEG